jgi:hypothetical protein
MPLPPIRALNEEDHRPVGVAHITLTTTLSFTYGRLPEERSGQVPVSVQGKSKYLHRSHYSSQSVLVQRTPSPHLSSRAGTKWS